MAQSKVKATRAAARRTSGNPQPHGPNQRAAHEHLGRRRRYARCPHFSARGSARSHHDSTNGRRPHLRAGRAFVIYEFVATQIHSTRARTSWSPRSAAPYVYAVRQATGKAWRSRVGGRAAGRAGACMVWSGGGAQPLRICTIQFQSIHAKLTLQPLGQIGAQAGGDHRTVPAGSHGRPWSSAGRLRPLSRAVGLA